MYFLWFIFCDYGSVSSCHWPVGCGHLCASYQLTVAFSSDTAADLPGCPAQVCLAWHSNLSWLAATGVDDLFFCVFFSFFICLDSCSRNSAGVWCQQRISTLAQRPAALRKHVLVGLITLSTWITIFLETSPKGKTLPNQWVRVSSSQEMSMKSLLIWT